MRAAFATSRIGLLSFGDGHELNLRRRVHSKVEGRFYKHRALFSTGVILGQCRLLLFKGTFFRGTKGDNGSNGPHDGFRGKNECLQQAVNSVTQENYSDL